MLSKKDKAIWVNPKRGLLVVTKKDGHGNKQEEEYDSLEGLITNIKTVETEDFNKQPCKQLHVEIYNPISLERYMLSTQMYKSFADGLLLALANAPMSKELKINAWSKPPEPGKKAPTFCSVYEKDTNRKIDWVEGIPNVEKHTIKNQTIVDRDEKNVFIDNIITDLESKVLNNKTMIEEKKRESGYS